MKTLGLIGRSLGHSFSKDYFSEKFKQLSLDNIQYKLFPIQSLDSLNSLLSKDESWIGFNVTIPYKTEIINYVDVLDEVAKSTGSVNTVSVYRENGKIKLKGYNTDVAGFEFQISQIKNLPSQALILGHGGVSHSVAYVLKKYNINFKWVSRNPKGETVLGYNELSESLISEYTLIIQTTPLGMYPNMDAMPDFPVEFIGRNHVVIDLIYNPQQTKFLKLCEDRGARVYNGLQMLHHQADEAWGIWKRDFNI